MGEHARVNFVVHSLGKYEEDLKRLSPNARIIHGERYTEEIDKLIETMYKNDRLKVKHSTVYYCEKCDEHYKAREIQRIEKQVKIGLVKIRIGRKLYFIGELQSHEQPLGVYIGEEDSLILIKFPDEKWLAPGSLKRVLVDEIEVPKKRIEEISKEKLKEMRFEPYVVVGPQSSHIIRRGEKEIGLLKGRISSYTVIFSVEKKVPINVCPRCGSVLREEKVPILYARDDNEAYMLSSPGGTFKLPVLYCSVCGHIEYGTQIKECPVCGNILERPFFLKPSLMAVGAYIHNLNNQSLGVIHQSRVEVANSIENVLRFYDHKPFIRRIVLSHLLNDELSEDEMCVLLFKRRGKIGKEDLKKLRKLKNVVENIVRYIEIYGSTEEYNDIDEWALWKNETLKSKVIELVRSGKIEEAFNLLYSYILDDISHFYIPLKRKESIARGVVRDILLMLYPYLPDFSLKLLGKLGMEIEPISLEEHPEIEAVEVLYELLKVLLSYRARNNVPRREPLKKVVFVSEYWEDVNTLLPYLFKVENILAFNAVREWDEMEIEVEPNIEEISAAYRAWAPKIAFLLRRKNFKEVMDAMEKGGYTLGVEGFIIKITPKMVRYLKKVPEGYKQVETRYGDVYIYTERDASTRRIRLVKEIIRRINSMRKDIDMDFDDLIDVSISGDSEAIKMIKGYDDDIRERCLARNIEFKASDYGYVVEWPIMGYRITIGINPLFKRWVIKAFKSIPGVDEARAELLFRLGFGSIYELMETKPQELSEMTGIPLNLANEIIDYLYSTAFKSKKDKKKEYCPFCGAELSPEDDYCPFCGAPIRVKLKESRMKKGNLYIVIGDTRKMIEGIPEDLLKGRKLLITKDDPEEVKKNFNLKNVSTIWISYVPFGKSIKPKELDKLENEINRFLDRGGKLILVDCFDLLLAINSLDTLMEILQRIKKKLVEKNAHMFFNIEEIESFELEKIMKYVDGEIK